MPTYSFSHTAAAIEAIHARAELGADGVVTVADYGAAGDGTTDDTSAIQAAITAAEANSYKLVFPRATYRFTSALSISGIDVDFRKSVLKYDGDTGVFALSLFSNAGASLNQRNGNRFTDLNLIQEDFTEYTTYSGSKTYDPPSIDAYSTVTQITPEYNSTTVTVTGARAGGYCRVTFDQLADGCTVCGTVTADDTVTVYFNNYTASAVNMASGNLSVDVVNNAYHGLCVGGGLGVLDNFKVQGFTGISMAMGDGLCQITGVDFTGTKQCYYWRVSGNLTPAAGFGLVVRPRNNENLFNLSLFPINAYGDTVPYRASSINQVIMSGVTNTFQKLSLEGVSSEQALIITDAANLITGTCAAYYEENTNFVDPTEPYVHAMPYSSGCTLRFRMYGGLGKLLDEGVANELHADAVSYINSQVIHPPTGGPSLIFNGDFENGTNGWTNWSTGSTLTYPGDGYLSGQRVRIDTVSGRVNLQQEVDEVGPASIDGLTGKTITYSAWIKTDLNNLVLRANGIPSVEVIPDDEWHFVVLTSRNNSATDLSFSVIESTNTSQSGYVEVSNVAATIGTRPHAFGERTSPIGSATYNPASLSDGARASTTITVFGAALGDHVTGVSFSNDLQGLHLWGYVSAADTVTAVFENNTGAAVDLASGTLRARVQKA